MSLPEEDREDLAIAASLHNLGHIGTPDILLERGPQTTEEERVFQGYPERGARILGACPELRSAADMVRFHREHLTAPVIHADCRESRYPLCVGSSGWPRSMNLF